MKFRLAILVSFFALWVLAITVRLYQIQVVNHDHYIKKAKRQQERVLQLKASRGRILDARGRLLALSLNVGSAYAIPPQIEDPKTTASTLASRIPGLDSTRLEARLRSDREFVWVSRQLDPSLVKSVLALELPGIYFLPEAKRYYPMREEASQVLGFAGIEHRGLTGLELFYDRRLTGESVLYKVLRDARGSRVDLLFFEEPKPGEDLRLTLDASIQYFAEQVLEQAIEIFRARTASVVLLAPEDGSVLAMASYPGFDLNDPGRYEVSRQRIQITRDLYAPGSLFLAVAAAGSIEVGLQKPEVFPGFEAGTGIHASEAALRRVARTQTLYAKLRELGFGQLTRIDLPGERAGIFEPPTDEPAEGTSSPYPGLAVTPLQLATALNALINGGFRVQPHLAQSSLDPPPRVLSWKTTEAFRPFWREDIVRGRGSGPPRNVYRLAGLRGRAIGPLDGPRDPTIMDIYFGFAPTSRPVLSGLVLIDGVIDGIEERGMASFIFEQIALKTLRYLRVRPEPSSIGPWPGQTPAR